MSGLTNTGLRHSDTGQGPGRLAADAGRGDVWQGLPFALLLFGIAAAASIILFPVGFQGWDDLEYLVAAERWLREGAHAGANHWANRVPYVLSFAAAFRLLGTSEAALVALHTLLFAAVALTAWGLARIAFAAADHGRRAPLCALAVTLGTPLLFRFPTTFYPEALEIALAGLCLLLVLSRPLGKRRAARLVLAGLLGGMAVLVRQTAIALPLALGPLMLAELGAPLRTRIRDVAWLALGFVLAQAAETAFHLLLTGDPLYRFHTDARHVEIPSTHMADGVYQGGGGILFNWQLASRWQVPSMFSVHWSLTPLLRLMTSPGLLLTPWLALAGGVLAWRAGGAARRFALLAGLVLGLHYLLNTFVLVIAPNTRYFGLALLLLCPLAGYTLAALPWRVAVAAIFVLFVVPTLAVGMLQPRPGSAVEGLERLLPLAGAEIVHLPPGIANAATLRLRNDPVLAARTALVPVPPGGLTVGGRFGWPEGWSEGEGPEIRCPDGGAGLERLATATPASPVWATIEAAGLALLVPTRLVPTLRLDGEALHLLRRRC